MRASDRLAIMDEFGPTCWVRGSLNCETHHVLGLLTTPTKLHVLIGKMCHRNGSAFLGYQSWLPPQLVSRKRWRTSRHPLLRGAAVSSDPSSGEGPPPQLRKATWPFGVQPERKPRIQGLFPRQALCTLPGDEGHRPRRTGLHRGEQELGLAARSPACSRRFRGRRPDWPCLSSWLGHRFRAMGKLSRLSIGFIEH